MTIKEQLPIHKQAYPCFLLTLGLLFGLGIAIDWDISFKTNLSSSNFWDALSAIGTIIAAIAALFVAHKGWKKGREIHEEQIEENRRLKNEVDAQKDYSNSLLACHHFHYMARLAALLDCTNGKLNNIDEHRHNINEISDLWKQAIGSEALSDTMLFIRNWKNRNLLDDMIIYLTTSRALVNNTSTPKVDKAIFKHLRLAADLFKELSLLNCQTKLLLLYNQNDLTPEIVNANENLKLEIEKSESIAEEAYNRIPSYKENHAAAGRAPSS